MHYEIRHYSIDDDEMSFDQIRDRSSLQSTHRTFDDAMNALKTISNDVESYDETSIDDRLSRSCYYVNDDNNDECVFVLFAIDDNDNVVDHDAIDCFDIDNDTFVDAMSTRDAMMHLIKLCDNAHNIDNETKRALKTLKCLMHQKHVDDIEQTTTLHELCDVIMFG